MEWLSILPPIIALIIVLWQREVILALITALISSEILHAIKGEAGMMASIGSGLIGTLEAMVNAMSSASNSRILIFSLLVGALIAFMRQSGGVSALVVYLEKKGVASSPRRAGLLSFFTGLFIFIETNLSMLTAGILSRGLFDKFKMSRARLAYIIDSTCAPVAILVLLNGWGAYLLGLLENYELEQSSISVLIATIPLNFYALTTLIVVLYTIFSGKVYGPMRKSEQQLSHINQVSPLDIQPTKARLMLIPLATMVFGMLGFMLWTGNGDITQGSGSKSILYATFLACLVAYVLMRFTQKTSHNEVLKIGFSGMAELLPLVVILLLSIALGTSLKALGTGYFIAGIISDSLPLFTIPALLFIAGALMAFTTGTSWGTFAILVPIGMPLVQHLGLDPALVMAAIMGGGVFGDHASPISDTTAVSSVASGCDLLEHVETQLPYALFAASVALVGYLAMGVILAP